MDLQLNVVVVAAAVLVVVVVVVVWVVVAFPVFDWEPCLWPWKHF